MSKSNNITNTQRARVYNPLEENLVKEYNKHRPLGPQETLCYAPFKNMYFGHYGRVVACCYNRSHVLGVYPQKSIKEIWFGDKAIALREYIQHNDLSLGCRSCKSHFIGGNFDALKAKMYDEAPANENHYPSVMEFELSNICNLECVMCNGDFSSSIRKNREKLPPVLSPYDDAFVKQLEVFMPYLHEVKFYGGEPFLVPIYYDIWETIIRINPKVRISVQTNATILNERVKSLLQQANFHLNISLDSLQKETYEKIRVNADFDRVMDNISYFRQYCKEKDTFFGISTCVMRYNWKELPDFIRFCNDLNVSVYFHTVWQPANSSVWKLPSDELCRIIDFLKSFDPPHENNNQQKNRQHYLDQLNLIQKWYSKKRETEVEIIRINTDPEIIKQRKLLRTRDYMTNAKEKFFNEMQQYILQRHDLNKQADAEKQLSLEDKFYTILNSLSENFPMEHFYEKMNTADIAEVVQKLENMTLQQFSDKLINFMKPPDYFIP